MKIKEIIFLILVVAIVFQIPSPQQIDVLAKNVKTPFTIVIDAGHGGQDGGAEAADGTLEADLNLAVAKAVKMEAEKRGFLVIMTREVSDGLYGEENIEKKWRKVDDMKCRKNIIDCSGANIALSIHMNCFKQDTSVKGAQMFYPSKGETSIKEESKYIAEAIQQQFIQGLQDGSHRKVMEKADVYLLENPVVPTVLVECGFLSNLEDLAHLKNPDWQQKIAVCILDGIEEF